MSNGSPKQALWWSGKVKCSSTLRSSVIWHYQGLILVCKHTFWNRYLALVNSTITFRDHQNFVRLGVASHHLILRTCAVIGTTEVSLSLNICQGIIYRTLRVIFVPLSPLFIRAQSPVLLSVDTYLANHHQTNTLRRCIYLSDTFSISLCSESVRFCFCLYG